MAVAANTSSAVQTFSNVNTKSWTHTASGSNRVVYVVVCWYTTPGSPTVTYNGVSMTLVGSSTRAGFGGSGAVGTCSLYRLLNPPTGSQTIVASWTGNNYGVAGSLSLTGVDQATPNGSMTTASSAGSTTPSATEPASTTGNLVLGAFIADFGLSSTGITAGRTLAWSGQERANSGYSGGLEYASAGGGSEAMNWTINASKIWAAFAIEVNAAAGGPVEANGSAAGVGAASGGSAAVASATAAAAGTGAASGAASAVASSTGAISGTSLADGQSGSASIAEGDGDASGLASATASSATVAGVVASADGTAAASGDGEAVSGAPPEPPTLPPLLIVMPRKKPKRKKNEEEELVIEWPVQPTFLTAEAIADAEFAELFSLLLV